MWKSTFSFAMENNESLGSVTKLKHADHDFCHCPNGRLWIHSGDLENAVAASLSQPECRKVFFSH
jgi:hypothetical protein